MSFTTEVKEELSRVAPGCSHCENATLAALIRIEGTLLMKGQGRYALEIATDSPVVARFIIKALHENYHLTTDLTMRRSVLHKTPNWLIEVPMQPGLNETLKELGILGEDGLERGIDPALIAKQCCAAAYLRGVFLGSGFISNPRGDFHFELKVETEATANAIVELLKERGIKARAIQRRNSYLIYLKSGTAISSFLALVGAHQSALKMENERVVKSVRNDVNRRVNAELANQTRSAGAAQHQLALIDELDRRGLRETLPDALAVFCDLRERYPDLSLRDLGEMADPPLSKSALYHRVLRLEKLIEASG